MASEEETGNTVSPQETNDNRARLITNKGLTPEPPMPGRPKPRPASRASTGQRHVRHETRDEYPSGNV